MDDLIYELSNEDNFQSLPPPTPQALYKFIRPETFSHNLFIENNQQKNYPIFESDCNILFCWDSSRSSLYYAFEMYQIIKANSFPPNLGGPKIKFLITEFREDPDFWCQAFKDLFFKYTGTEETIDSFLKDAIIRPKLKEIRLRQGQIPYDQNEPEGHLYQPTQVVFFGDLSKAKYKITCDLIHSQRSYNRKEYHSILNHSFNFICLYYEFNLAKNMYKIFPKSKPQTSEDHSKIIEFDDIQRIDFKNFIPTKEQPENVYAVYTKSYKPNDLRTRNIIVDDIIDSLSSHKLAKHFPLAAQLRKIKKESIRAAKNMKLTAEELIEVGLNSGLLENYPNTEEAKTKILAGDFYEFIVINDTEINHETKIKNIEKEKMNLSIDIMRRGLERGIHIRAKEYTKEQLPRKNIYDEFQIFIYSSYLNYKSNWKEDNRFIPECHWYNKKIILSPSTSAGHIHLGLRSRIQKTNNRWFTLKEEPRREYCQETQSFKIFYKSKIINNLLGNWGY